MGDNDQQQPPVPTGNPWPALRESASQGRLEFEQDVAYQCAQLAADLIEKIRALQVVAKEVADEHAVSDLPTGIALGKKFAAKADQLDEILGKHIEILEDMVATFISAGKNYDAGEQDNEAMFDGIRHSGTARLSSQPPVATELPARPDDASKRFRDPKDSLQNLRTAEPWVGMAENPYEQSWGQLYSLGNYIYAHYTAQRAINWSGKWRWMAGQVQTIFSEFATYVDSVTLEQWEGRGREAAVNSIKAYAGSIPALKNSMTAVADNLEYTSGWLEATRVSMPQTETNPAGSVQVYASGYNLSYGTTYSSFTTPDNTRWYQDAMRDTYVKGLNFTAEKIPVLPPAEGAFREIPVDPTRTTNTNPGPGTAPPGPPGPPGNALSPGPGPGMTPQQRDAIQRQEAAQRRAEAAARKQQEAAARFQREQQAAARRQQQEAAQFQREQQAAARQQQAQQAAAQAAQQGQQAMQQAMQAGQQAAQQAMQAAQQAAQKELADRQRAGLPGIPSIPGTEIDPKTGLPKVGAGPGPGPGMPSSPVGKDVAQAAKLFPRASTAVTGTATGTAAGRAGMAPMAGMPGSPGAAGAAGRGAGEAGNQHKRPTFLDSTEHLEDALGEAPRVVKPVVEK